MAAPQSVYPHASFIPREVTEASPPRRTYGFDLPMNWHK